MILDSDNDITPEQLSVLIQNDICKTFGFTSISIYVSDMPSTEMTVKIIVTIFKRNICGYNIAIQKAAHTYNLTDISKDELDETLTLSKEWQHYVH